jgi:hypothetical protein
MGQSWWEFTCKERFFSLLKTFTHNIHQKKVMRICQPVEVAVWSVILHTNSGMVAEKKTHILSVDIIIRTSKQIASIKSLLLYYFTFPNMTINIASIVMIFGFYNQNTYFTYLGLISIQNNDQLLYLRKSWFLYDHQCPP